jgi:3-hydroxyisobutyrate dehydrogenase-like beta-hydroxyacid dehydrogenase
MTISFVGLGAMGSRGAARLLDGNSRYVALEAARDLDTTVASANTALGALERAEARGFSRRDIAALYQALRIESPTSASPQHAVAGRKQ